MPELTPRYHWLVPAPQPVSEATVDEARRRGLSARALRVLTRRGPVDVASLAALLDDPALGLHDPALLPDGPAVVARIELARRRRERALVLGDFDADGLTGLAILVIALRRLGLDAEPYVPDRVLEGHGLSLRAVTRARDQGRTLLLTADTGSTSHAEVAAAAGAGIDVIVTDHHALPPALPGALALVNPQRVDGCYPDRRLSGAGVAFKVAQLLLAGEPGGPAAALDLADLAAIGSVADVVPLQGENRAILRLGLRAIARGGRPGLAALLTSAGVAPEDVDAEAIGYRIAPRLNAMGRVGDASVAAELLLAEDPAEAAVLVTRLESANDLRRELMAGALAEARAAVEAGGESPLIVVAGDWPVGVIGLVAGRLAEDLGRPAVVLSTQVSPWRGSARSAGGFDLAAAFEDCHDLLERHGGHAAAAGCHLPPENLAAFTGRLRGLAEALPSAPGRASLRLDLVQRADSVDHVLLRELTPLEEGGEAPPVIGVAGLVVARCRAANGGHTQLVLRRGRDVLDGICFGRSDLVGVLQEGQVVDVAARLSSRRFAGLETLQLEVLDVAPEGWLAGLRAGAALATGSGARPPEPAERLAASLPT